MTGRMRWVQATILAMLIIGIPVLRYRIVYNTEKRFREVTPGKFYRCGQMSSEAFRKEIRAHGIKLVVNLQDEYPDPLLSTGYWDTPSLPESEVRADAGARFMFLTWY